jgi:hypothetical protein
MEASAAVAVIVCPTGTLVPGKKVNERSPSTLVSTVVSPMNFLPSLVSAGLE